MTPARISGRLQARRVMWHDVDGQAVITEPDSPTLALNPAAALLWRHLVDGVNKQGLVTALRDEFGIDELTAARDVEAFLVGLAMRGLLAEAV